MSNEILMSILKEVLFVIAGGLFVFAKSYYTIKKEKINSQKEKVISDVTAKASGLITEAEKEYSSYFKAGGLKKEWVVNHLYNFIPVKIRPFISRELIEDIVQTIFDGTQDYAKTQLNKAIGKVEEKVDDVINAK